MENIYKIKVRSNPDPRGLYPSERRYSASTVLGLGVVHLALAVTALLLASLSLLAEQGVFPGNATDIFDHSTLFDPYYNLSLAPCVTSVGALIAGLSALLAWKRWYIDHNIGWFFLMSVVSSCTSAACVVATTFTIVAVYERTLTTGYDFTARPNVRFTFAVNVLVACTLELLWSALSAKVAFAGMRNTYPDDIIISKNRGKIQVCTVHKGNKKERIVPPDILNHFPTSGKIAKYLPKVESGNLPKAESNSEYQERVRQFLSSNVDGESLKSNK